MLQLYWHSVIGQIDKVAFVLSCLNFSWENYIGGKFYIRCILWSTSLMSGHGECAWHKSDNKSQLAVLDILRLYRVLRVFCGSWFETRSIPSTQNLLPTDFYRSIFVHWIVLILHWIKKNNMINLGNYLNSNQIY